MKYHSLIRLAPLGVWTLVPMIGCTYEPPQATPTTGAGGAQASSSSGQGGSSGQAGAGGQAGVGGQGGGGVEPCTKPNEEVACMPYSGPDLTSGVGTCHPSSKICQMDLTWSPCNNERIPMPEGCAGSNADTNCDNVPPCTGKPITSYTNVSDKYPNDDVILDVATGPDVKGVDGPVYAVGYRGALPNLQNEPDNYQVLVWARDPAGGVSDWSNQFNFSPNMLIMAHRAKAVAVGVLPANGDVLVAGNFEGGTLKIGTLPQVNAAETNSFIARFSGTTGLIAGAFYLTSAGEIVINAMATDRQGNVFVGGYYSGNNAQIHTQSLPPVPAGDRDGFIAKLTSAGNVVWAQVVKGISIQNVVGVASIAEGNTSNHDIVMATSFETSASIVTTINSPENFNGDTSPDMIISRLDGGSGQALWNKQIVGSGITTRFQLGGLAANTSTVAWGARFTGSVTLGPDTITNMDVIDNTDAFIATMATSDGALGPYVVAKAPGTQDVRDVAIDSFGDIVAVGGYSNMLPIAPLNLNSSNALDVFVVKLHPGATGQWAQAFGDSELQSAGAVVIGKATGRIFVGGAFRGSLDGLDPKPQSTDKYDPFLIELSD